MLSRTADHLYWLGRYVERAESLARALDVQIQLSYLPQPAHFVAAGWLDTLDELGLLESYREQHGEVDAERAPRYIALAPDTVLSIRGCLQAARENARAVRGAITSEMWETVNTTWLELRTRATGQASAADLREFIEWVKLRSQLLRGVNMGTMLRDEAYAFLRMGTALERADGTARILGARLATSSGGTGVGDFHQWSVLLRAMSAFENYRKLHRHTIEPESVARLLVLNGEEPRSLRRAASDLYEGLRIVANHRSQETERCAGAHEARLRFASHEDVKLGKLREFLDDCVGRLRDIHQGICEDFLP
ncbi:MAG: hypothetical protein RL026_1435 [Pseudomonadota bacterium]|jgi:uncharacterized alpha-E superfamily protein